MLINIVALCHGDLRKALNILELYVTNSDMINLNIFNEV